MGNQSEHSCNKDYIGKYGLCITVHEPQLLASEDDYEKFVKTLGLVFECVDVTEGFYYKIQCLEQIFHVKCVNFNVEGIDSKIFYKFRQQVQSITNPEKIGNIYKIAWHHKRNEPIYYIEYETRKSTRRYLSHELQLVDS